jgi:hypothetical protein
MSGGTLFGSAAKTTIPLLIVHPRVICIAAIRFDAHTRGGYITRAGESEFGWDGAKKNKAQTA